MQKYSKFPNPEKHHLPFKNENTIYMVQTVVSEVYF